MADRGSERARWLVGLAAIIALVLAIEFLRQGGVVLAPLAAAFFLAFLAQPAIAALQKKRLPFGLALALVMLGILVFLGGIGLLLREGLENFIDSLSSEQERVFRLWNQITARLGSLGRLLRSDRQDIQLGRSVASFAAAALGSLLSFVEQLVLVLVYTVFLLLGRRSLPGRLEKAFDAVRAEKAVATIVEMESKTARYLGLRTLICILTGCVVWLICALFQVRFAILWGVLTFVGQYVPIAGPIAASVPPLLMALLDQQPITVLWFAVALFAWHLAVGYFLEPRVFGHGMDLNQLLLLFGLAFFGWLWGALGAVLAVPILLMLRIVSAHVRPLRPIAVLLGEA
jgi:predicted PurR-regulated permease PerM